MARPVLSPSERRSELLKIRVTQDEQAAIKAGADGAQVPVSEFVRDAALAKARAVQRKAARKPAG